MQHQWWAFAAAILPKKWLKKWLCTLPDQAKIHPFISILNIGPSFRYLPKGSFYLFMLSVFLYNAALLSTGRSEIAKIWLFSDWNFQRPANQNNRHFTHDLVYDLTEGNTGITIFMPNSKCWLVAVGSLFLPAFVHLFSIVKWSLVMCCIC